MKMPFKSLRIWSLLLFNFVKSGIDKKKLVMEG